MRVTTVSKSAVTEKAAFCEKSAVTVKVTKISTRDTAAFSEKAVKTARRQAQNRAGRNADATVAKDSESDTANKSEQASSEVSNEKASFSDMLEDQTEKLESMFGNSSDTRLSSIRKKMSSGIALSPNEEAYLSQKDPNSYSNYRATQDARRMFRCQLSACRTKDEVNGMRLSNALSAFSAYKKAAKNGGDVSAVADLNKALDNEIIEYAKSGKYQSLPTSAERDKYYMELAKARKYEREKRAAALLNSSRKKKKQVKLPGDGKRTVAQVENSPLGRKVRKAERGGFSGCSFSFYSGRLSFKG